MSEGLLFEKCVDNFKVMGGYFSIQVFNLSDQCTFYP